MFNRRYTAADRQPPTRRGPAYFLAFLRSAGVQLAVTADGRLQIHAPLGNVSPVLEEAIREREQALVELVRAETPQATVRPQPVRVEPTKADRLIWTGIQGAKAKAERQAGMLDKVRRGKQTAKQMRIEL